MAVHGTPALFGVLMDILGLSLIEFVSLNFLQFQNVAYKPDAYKRKPFGVRYLLKRPVARMGWLRGGQEKWR